ncbi:MAG: hypothetical protein HYS08_00435 [Chlamydiae bacterium]|nr:hypothetical protein [Chlamydiota bacterium]MBI3266210.1 hypothetical protein [Chlamydiota bacterium]
MKRVLICLLGMGMMIEAMSGANARGEEGKRGREIFVRFKAEVSQDRIQDLFKEYQLEVIEKYPAIENLYLCKVPLDLKTQAVIRKLEKEGDVAYVEANQKVEALEVR